MSDHDLHRPDEPAEPPSEPRLAALLAPLVPGRTLAPEQEERLFRRLQAELHVGRRRPFDVSRALLVTGALAAVAGLVAVVLRPSESATDAPEPLLGAPAPVVAARSEPPARLHEDGMLPSGAHVRFHGGRVDVLAASADVTHLRVVEGGVTSKVPRLAAGQRYEVETPQALVRVHGTQFTVTRASVATTRVEVSEGLVSVDPPGWRPAFFLKPGETAEVGPCPETPAEAAASLDDWRCAADGLRFEAEAAATAGDLLSRDNLRLRAARLLARHAPREAVEVWRALLADAPEGIHAEEAAFGLAESLFRAGDRLGARAAAAAFRTRFPHSPLVSATKQF